MQIVLGQLITTQGQNLKYLFPDFHETSPDFCWILFLDETVNPILVHVKDWHWNCTAPIPKPMLIISDADLHNMLVMYIC